MSFPISDYLHVLQDEQTLMFYLSCSQFYLLLQGDEWNFSIPVLSCILLHISSYQILLSLVLFIAVGLMGASSSDHTKALQQFAEDNSLPLVSYTSTAPELSDVNIYQNFMRTIPPDDLLTKVKWWFKLRTLFKLL